LVIQEDFVCETTVFILSLEQTTCLRNFQPDESRLYCSENKILVPARIVAFMLSVAKQKRLYALAVFVILLARPGSTAWGQRRDDFCSGLNAGYCDMYNLQFAEAHRAFAEWQRLHPEDPMGPASDAAAYLFAEFDRLHILESEFLTNDKSFENRKQLTPDAEARRQFDAQLEKAGSLIRERLSRDSRDTNARFANVLRLALRGDYVALIEKRNVAGLSYLKQARIAAQALLKTDPSCYDAYLAIGVENYLLSLRSAPVRWILQMGGAQVDKDAGLKNLRVTSQKGHYLQPYARLLLAIAALRDQDRSTARLLLQELAMQFPNNRLYATELARLR
jgi:hypothetical protein